MDSNDSSYGFFNHGETLGFTGGGNAKGNLKMLEMGDWEEDGIVTQSRGDR